MPTTSSRDTMTIRVPHYGEGRVATIQVPVSEPHPPVELQAEVIPALIYALAKALQGAKT